MPSLTQLSYALAVEKHRHFGKAAEACHVSQPTLSVQLQRLEDEVGLMIFDRLQKPVIPTVEGRSFLEQARVVLREHEKLRHLARATSEEPVGDFRLGVIPTVASSLLPLFVGSFSEACPKVDLHVEELKTADILKALKEDQLDGAIIATPIAEQGFKVHPLYYEPFLAYFSKSHELLKKTTIEAADLDGSEMWLLRDGHCFKDQVVKFCSIDQEDQAVLKNVHFRSGSLETLKYLVQQGRGCTLIPGLLAEFLPAAENRRHVRPFKNPAPTREISFIYRRDHWKLDIIDALKTSIQDVVPEDFRKHDSKRQVVLEVC